MILNKQKNKTLEHDDVLDKDITLDLIACIASFVLLLSSIKKKIIKILLLNVLFNNLLYA
jgi:hypothetical protein